MQTDKEFSISPQSQKELLGLSRKAIQEYLSNAKILNFQTKSLELLTPAAVFVTLTQDKNLRGCIGTTEALYPLYEAVMRMSLAAALNDSRFFPLAKEELDKTNIEISVLSPMQKVKTAGEIIQHKHGVLIKKGARSGLFLPQVWEHFSNKEDFLNELCSQKAGLPKNAWKDPLTDIFIFTVFSFAD